jgi:hypothetical protein
MITPSKEFLEVFKNTDGALSVTESISLINIAAQAPEGIFLELGTHKGKSTMSLLAGLPKGDIGLVEPSFTDSEINPVDVVKTIIPFSKHKRSIFVIPDYSINILPNQPKMAFVFVDSGSHGDGLPMQEVKLLEDIMIENGIICFHDYLNQFVEVEQAYKYLLGTGKYEEIKIDWQEIFDYVNEHNLEEGNKSWHVYPELGHPPNFVGALRRK